MSSAGKMKVHKKKKVGELVGDCIDNTGSVQKILEVLNQKNAQAYSLYKQTLKQRRTTSGYLHNFHSTLPGHPLNAVSEDWEGQLETSFLEPFGHKSFPPRMINNMRNIGKSDPVTNCLKLKQHWHRVCKILRHTAFLSKITDKFEKLNDDVAICPKHLVDIAAHLDSDPDRYFNSSYNWYYAGSGNIQVICIDWLDYLLHSVFSCVYLTGFNRLNASVGLDVAKFDCGEEVNILETICSTQNIVALRTTNRVYILKIVVADTLEFELLKVMESELPYTGVSFDGYHKNILYVTTIDNKLNIVNLDRMVGQLVKLKANTSTLVDNWNTVISSDRSFYTHIGRRSVSLYDKRSNESSYIWSDVRKVTDEMNCNDISAGLQSQSTPTVYVTTDHHLFLLDLRYSDRQKIGPVQRWTHGMQCVPAYISKCHFELGKDLVCLSSQWCEDMCVLPNFSEHRRDLDMLNLVIPYRPPSILKALDEARANKMCCDLYNPIDTRLHMSITGCTVLEQGETYNVLLQNSLGDLSCHTIFPEHFDTFIVDDRSIQLHEWCESYKLVKKDFEVSSLVDIAHVWKKLKKVQEGCLVGDLRSTVRDKNKFSEMEIHEAFEKEIDSGLLEVWTRGPDDTAVEHSSVALNLHFSDSE